MNNEIKIEKKIWTQDDYKIMGWHDSNIYGFTFNINEDEDTNDLVLDIDYIFKWIKPVPPSEYYTFWVAPCTLIFNKPFDIEIEISSHGSYLDLLEIADINLINKYEQEKNKFVYEWTIELQQGKIKLKSYGYKQIVRKEPIHIEKQILTSEERGGISFLDKPY